MELAISLKFSQHKDLKRELLATGDAELIEVRATCPVERSKPIPEGLRTPIELRPRVVLGLWARGKGEKRVGQGS